MLLRDEREMALNDVETLCAEAADHYASAANRVQDAPLAALFAELALQYRQFAAALAQHIRAGGDLPQQPDPDKETVADAFTSIKGLLRGDLRSTLIDDRARGEDALAAAVRTALEHDVDSALRALLHDVRAQSEAAKHKLNLARAAAP